MLWGPMRGNHGRIPRAEKVAPLRHSVAPRSSGILRKSLLLFAFAVPGLIQAAPAAQNLNSVSAIRHATPQPGASAAPVHVRAVVTYYDSAGPNLFVQDRTGGVWVDLRGVKLEPPKPGQLLDLNGDLGFGFTPYIAHPRWVVVGPAALPRPIHLTYEQAATGHYDGQWVEMDGVVRSFVQQSDGNILVMDVATGTGSFKVRVPGYHAGFPMYLIDASVRFRGVAGSAFNTRKQLVAMHLLMPSLNQLEILKPAPANPFAIAVSPIDTIRRFSADATEVHRVKILGVVTARFPGRGLYVSDATGGVYVESQDGSPAEPGAQVEVSGFPAAGAYSPMLLSGAIHPTGKRFPQTAVPVTGREALRGGFDAQLVAMAGTLRSHYRHGGTTVLVIDSADNVSFEAVLAQPARLGWEIPDGSKLQITGICTVKADDNGNPAEFQIVLRSPADVHVVSSPPWLTSPRALTLLAALALVTLGVIAWVVVLRRRVAHQMRVIQLRLESEAALEERYRRVFERNIAGLYIAAPDGALLDCNEACARILGFTSREDVLQQKQRACEIVRQFWDSDAPSDPVRNAEHRFQRNDGSWAWALANARRVPNGNIEGALVDITDRKLADEQIKFLAFFDSLTGLPNRSLVQDRLTKAIAAARRNREKVAVLFLDLDRFKNINDSLGHSHGDALLQKVARRLELCAREEDTVARLGGDEFLLVLNSIHTNADAGRVAERICREVASGFEVLGQAMNVTCSIGISLFPEHGNNVETLIKNADAAMYRSKEDGRNTFRFFSEEMTAQATERLLLENSLRAALEEEQFFLRFQPEFDLATGAIVCSEALLRWNHPTLGPISPDRFIPIAESTGIIVPLGEWVLRAACREAQKWQQESQVGVPVAVNVSAVQLNQPGFCSTIERILEENGLEARHLELELTESVLLAHHDVTYQVFGELQALGVTLAIDDFGTGYSSLSYLKQFPVRKLKIDRSFIRDIDIDSDNAAITAAIIHMAKCLGIKAVAEGVETEAQLGLLRSMGCDQVQGFLLSEPLSGGQIPHRVRQSASPETLSKFSNAARQRPTTPALSRRVGDVHRGPASDPAIRLPDLT